MKTNLFQLITYNLQLSAPWLTVAALVTMITMVVVTQSVHAQLSPEIETTRLTALPARLGDADYSLHAKPGELVQTSVQIKNSSETVQTIRTSIDDFTVIDDAGQPVPVVPGTPSKWKMADWITLTPDTQTLSTGQVGEITLSIQVPADALPGGRYAMVMSAPVAKDNTAGSGTGISQQVGTLLYFVVDGQINEEAYIRDVQIKKWFEFGPVPFSFVMDNRSDIHITPQIQVTITNMLGQQSDEFLIESKNIFPGSERLFEEVWQRRFGLGKYSGIITASYGKSGLVTLGHFTFWMIPIRAILGILFVFSSGFYVLIAVARRMKEVREEERELGTRE